MKKLSRRTFLKGSLAGAAAVSLAKAGLPEVKSEAAGLNSKDPGEKPSFFTNPYNHKAEDAAKVFTTEVVIVGAGNAGCAAVSLMASPRHKWRKLFYFRLFFYASSPSTPSRVQTTTPSISVPGRL